MLTNKANTICFLKILKEFSDEEHVLRMSEVIAKMKSEYGLSIERKAVYGYVSLLQNLDYDISTPEDNGKGYFLRSRDLEISEVRLIMDSIFMNRSLPFKQSSELIRKLQKSMLSVHKRKPYANLAVSHTNIKTLNKEVFLNIEVLDEAITDRKKVAFTYLKYDFNINLQPRRDRKYIMSPYGMVAAYDYYYLVCNNDKYKEAAHYRIDKMKDIEILKEDINPPQPGFDVHEFAKQSIYMQRGLPEKIRLKCDNRVLDMIIDKFGTDIKLMPCTDEDCFIAEFIAIPSGVKYWLLQFVSSCEVLTPKSLRDDVIEILKNNKYTGVL